MSGFGARLKAERKRLALSAGKFSALCGVAENAQYNYEKETRSPDSDYLEKAAEAGVDVLFLITGQKMTSMLAEDQMQLLSAYAAATPALRAAALAVLASETQPSGSLITNDFRSGVGCVVQGGATFSAPIIVGKSHKNE